MHMTSLHGAFSASMPAGKGIALFEVCTLFLIFCVRVLSRSCPSFCHDALHWVPACSVQLPAWLPGLVSLCPKCQLPNLRERPARQIVGSVLADSEIVHTARSSVRCMLRAPCCQGHLFSIVPSSYVDLAVQYKVVVASLAAALTKSNASHPAALKHSLHSPLSYVTSPRDFARGAAPDASSVLPILQL